MQPTLHWRTLTRGATLTTIVVASALVVAGALGAVAVVQSAPPPQIASTVRVTSVPAEPSTFSDARTVDVAATTRSGGDVLIPTSGFVTSTNCVPGASISSGSVLLAINNVSLIALSTAGPLWRDLEPGDEGADVAALQTELARLGYAVGLDGTVGSETISAVKQLGTSAGIDTGGWEVVPRSAFVWIPAQQTAIESCIAVVGAFVGDGQAIATLPDVLVRFAVKLLPNDLTVGARALVWGGRTMPLNDAGEVTDPEDLAAVQSSAEFTSWLAATDQPLPTGSLELAEPLTVLTVPPSAVSVIDNRSGCVFSDATPYPVTIVGSSLGRTLVSVDIDSPPTEVDVDGQGRTCS